MRSAAVAAQIAVSWRRRLSALFDDALPTTWASQLFNSALAAVIVINVISVVLESVKFLRHGHAALFWWIEQTASMIFAAEYALRVWTAVDLHDAKFRHPVWGRLAYIRSFFAIVDLVAVFPAILGFLWGDNLRVLRIIRLLRMLKLTRHSSGFAMIWSVLREEAHAISYVVFMLCFLLTLSGAFMYMIEGEAQPEVFTSIPVAMWWAIETLTTVGYGDIVPATLAGRILGGIVSIAGIGTLAILSGLITVSFMGQLKLRHAGHHRVDDDSEASTRARPGFDGVCPRCGFSPTRQHSRARRRGFAIRARGRRTREEDA